MGDRSNNPQRDPEVGVKSASLHGMCTIADQAAVSLASFVVTVCVSRVGVEQLGLYALGMSLFWPLAGLVNALVWAPYTARACKLGDTRRGRYCANSTIHAMAIAAVVAVGAVLSGLAAMPLLADSHWLPWFCLSLAPMCVLLMLREHVRRIYIADFKGVKLVAFDLPICVALIGGVLALLWSGRLTAATAFLATAAAAALSLPIAWRMIRRGRKASDAFGGDLRRNWVFGRWLVVVAVAWLIGDGSLRWMLVGMHGMEAMGVFGAAFAAVMLLNPLLLALNAFARSYAARVLLAEGRTGLLRFAHRSTAFAALATVAALGGLALFSDAFITFAFGAEYANRWLVMVLAAGVLAEALCIPVEAALIAEERTREVSVASGTRLAITLVAGAPLIYATGPAGIGYVLVLRALAALAQQMVVLSRPPRDATTESPTATAPVARPAALSATPTGGVA